MYDAAKPPVIYMQLGFLNKSEKWAASRLGEKEKLCRTKNYATASPIEPRGGAANELVFARSINRPIEGANSAYDRSTRMTHVER